MLATNDPRAARSLLALTMLALAAAVGACSGPGAPASASAISSGSEWTAASASEPAASASAPISSPRPTFAELPDDFPVPAGVDPIPLPDDDAGLIARWTTSRPGPEMYQFYLHELPDAGYSIVGRYPGGAAAIIRFDAGEGVVWQVVLTGDTASTRIDIRLDRP